ncbi:MAG: AAA family ATPase [Planctomycetaceae bacterium]|nr:AAA family ATPase [Planctomycetaceae bacterium]
MSALDQAFIRAYQAGTTAPRTRMSTAQSQPTTSPTVETRTPIGAAADAALRHYVDGPHAFGGAPLQTAIPVFAEPAASVAAAAPPQLLEGQVQDTFRPAFETQRFAWPRNVEVLIAAAGTEFAQFVGEMEERIRGGRRTLVVTGCERGEGRTTLTLALARLLANRGLRTVLLDCDLQTPQLAESLGIRPEIGWDDVYAERLPAADAMIESVHDRLTVLPMRNGLANPRAMAGNRLLADIVDQLRARYDAVLIDAGPLADDQAAIDLTAVLTGVRLDDALVVRDRRRTSSKDVQAVCRRLSALGVHHWDIAENFTELQGY